MPSRTRAGMGIHEVVGPDAGLVLYLVGKLPASPLDRLGQLVRWVVRVARLLLQQAAALYAW
eukprot:2509001-Pyramimonas_sp.AAC.1